jgi:hypothetical protein
MYDKREKIGLIFGALVIFIYGVVMGFSISSSKFATSPMLRGCVALMIMISVWCIFGEPIIRYTGQGDKEKQPARCDAP